MTKYRIILADDHRLFRAGVRRIIEERAELEVAGEASDGLELLQILRRSKPDLIVLDLSMPNLSGIDAFAEIRALHPEVKILVLTMHKEPDYFQHTVSSGASGYLLKDDTSSELLGAIDVIRQGRIFVSPLVTREILEDVVRASRRKRSDSRSHALTAREREVLRLVAQGNSSREVAHRLSISVRTVEHHRANILTRLNLKSSAEMVRYAIREGFANGVSGSETPTDASAPVPAGRGSPPDSA
jgi:DNA-binding NarL/FixJ family response regulator